MQTRRGSSGRFGLTSPSLQHCDYTTTRRLTVVVGLVLRLQPRDGQGGRVGGAVYGAREPIRNPGGSIVIFIDHSPGDTAWPLLVPVHISAPNVAAAAGAGDGDCLSRRPRHRLGLSQHKMGPRPCKEGATQRSVSQDRPCSQGGRKGHGPRGQIPALPDFPSGPTCAVSQEGEDKWSPIHGLSLIHI